MNDIISRICIISFEKSYLKKHLLSVKKEYPLFVDLKDSIVKNTEEVTVSNPSLDKAYSVVISLYYGDELVKELTSQIKIKETMDDKLVLKGDKEKGETGGIKLVWNSLDNVDNRYSYRIYRKQDNENWESISSWNGTEKIRVLNIYPAPFAENFLINWMEEPLEKEESSAGKGLMQIDKVFIDEFNAHPNQYLKDENGYRYDVLMFGISDGNAYMDLDRLWISR